MAVVLQTDIYSRALAEATSELEGVRFEMGELTKRQAQLEALIANLAPLVPQVKPTLKFPEPAAPVVSTALVPQPIWKSILQSINEKAGAFTVKDAIDGLNRIGRPIDSPNRFQIVRAVLTKKTQNFVQLGPGLFAVRGQKEKEVPEGTS